MISKNIQKISEYKNGRTRTPVDLLLDGNEGVPPDLSEILDKIKNKPDILCRYPDITELKYLLAKKNNIDSDRLLVTAGGDEAIDRVCRLTLSQSKNAILPVPTFSMFYRYILLAGGKIKEINWQRGEFPTLKVLEVIDEKTSLIVIVSPNNPTGLVVSKKAITNIAKAANGSTILIDLAYSEFASEDLTQHALQYNNCIVIKSMSKAWGLAGLRVGYALGNENIISLLEKAGGPYSVSSISCVLAIEALKKDAYVDDYVKTVKENRKLISDALNELSIKTENSQGNFILARTVKAKWIKDNLAGLGISIRTFDYDHNLKNYIRITVPPADELNRLLTALKTILKPEVILFDMDGVLADVSRSYRKTIIETSKAFGCSLTYKEISAKKQSGQANNDWEITFQLIRDKDICVTFEDVKSEFERIYQGSENKDGLYINETLIPTIETLEYLKRKVRLGIVTGRPRKDAINFLNRFNIRDLFDVTVTLEDSEPKPSPEPIRLALRKLDVERAWLIGDTPDDIHSARKSSVLPLGIISPGENERTGIILQRAGAGRILKSIDEIKEYM